ncbi:MAG: hypothetical protein ACLTXT_03785 [Ruminococcus callidus]
MLLTPRGSPFRIRMQAKDTTGAGDAIIRALLFCLAEQDITKENVNEVTMNSGRHGCTLPCIMQLQRYGQQCIIVSRP